MDLINRFDFRILDFIQEHFRCRVLDMIMPAITKLGDGGVIWIVIALILICFRRTRKTGFMMGAALFCGLVIGNGLLKNLISRIRPYEINMKIELLIPKLYDYSFPSGHTLASFEAAGVLMLRERRRFGYAALVLAIGITLSRLYLYVHYPTDIIAGAALGVAFAFVACRAVEAIDEKIRAGKPKE